MLSASMTPANQTTRIAVKCSPNLEGLYKEFSNSYPPEFEYVVPMGTEKGTKILCEHANKAVHCTKASVFGDQRNFDAINAESDPETCLELGRQCTNFSDKKWLSLVEDIATDVLFEQFKHDGRLAHLLLSTGNAEIVNVRNIQV